MNSPIDSSAITQPSPMLDDFFDRIKPVSNTFEVVLNREDVLEFQLPSEAAELYATQQTARGFIDSVTSGKTHPSWKPYLTTDIRVLVYVINMAIMHTRRFRVTQSDNETIRTELPTFSQLDFLRLSKEAPLVFEAIRVAVDSHLTVDSQTRLVESVTVQKKESTPTPTTD
jgi:hypothetical protein